MTILAAMLEVKIILGFDRSIACLSSSKIIPNLKIVSKRTVLITHIQYKLD